MSTSTLPNPPPGMPIYLTTAEAASWLRVCTRTVKRWVAEGKLRAKRIGRKRLLEAADIRALMDASAGGEDAA